MKCTHDYRNAHVRLVSQHVLISHFCQTSNHIGKDNQAPQYTLGLEKKWETRDPYIYLTTAFIGVKEVDTWKLSTYHMLFLRLQMKHKAETGMVSNMFAGIITK